MKLILTKEQLETPGLEIAVSGFAGDSSKEPVQVFIEHYQGKLAVHVWDGSSEDCKTHFIKVNHETKARRK